MAPVRDGGCKGRYFGSEVILWAPRWYPAFPISHRDLSAMLADRGVAVDHATLFRRVRGPPAALGG
jgi:transposase-like protein